MMRSKLEGRMSDQYPTRLNLFCDGVIEGSWLAALVATPLFFNVYSNRIFEPDKTAVLRSIALIIALAWTVKGIEHWIATKSHQHPRPSLRALPRRLAAIPVLPFIMLLFVDYVFATFISVSPSVSLWGSYTRLQGLYTTFAYIGVFISMMALLRTRAQIDRLVTTVLVVSLPVSLYGVIQYFGTDPLAWGSDVTLRVASSMGNPVFVASFLIMTVPLTLYRLLLSGGAAAGNESTRTTRILMMGGLFSLAFQMAAWQAGPSAGTASAVITVATWVAIAVLLKKPLIPFLRVSSYTVLLSAQLMCILFSQSRGPWIGLVVGLFVFALLWALVRRQRKLAVLVIGSGLTVAVLLVVINWPGSPLGIVRDVPYIGRIGQLSNTDAGSSRVRVLIWEGIEDLVANDPVRAIVGSGPETLQLVYPRYYRPELRHVGGSTAIADRAHNEVFDALVTTGLVGLTIYLLFVTSLLYYSLKWIGLLGTSVRRNVFLWLWFAGGVSAMLLVVLIDGSWRFTGVALPGGMVAGLLVYLCWYGLFVKNDRRSEPADDSLQLIMVTLLAAVVAHFVEIQVGLAVVVTRTYFWSYAAVLVAVGFFHDKRPGLIESARLGAPVSLVATSMVLGFIVVTVIFDFMAPNIPAEAPTVFWLLVFTWGFGGLVVVAEMGPTDYAAADFRKWIRVFGVYGGTTLAIALLYAAVYLGAQRFGDDFGYIPLTYFVGALLIIIAIGYSLARVEPFSQRTSPLMPTLLYLVLAGGVLFVGYRTNLRVVQADAYFKQASQLHRQSQYDQATTLHRRALDLQFDQDVYHLGLGKILLERARASEDPEPLIQEAERALVTARALSPLNPDHTANLARLYQARAMSSDDHVTRSGQLSQALTFFEEATTLSPNTPHLWNDIGTTYLLMRDTTEARRIYEHSLSLDTAFFQTHLLMGNLDFAEKKWVDAARAYEAVIHLEPGLPNVYLALEIARARIER
jgi:tetratricopeptide (TPR) repeat protein/O-antigen ligase